MCEDIAIGEEEKCVDMVKLKKEKHEAKYCSFHPKTICKKTDSMKCRRVAKKLCHYVIMRNYEDEADYWTFLFVIIH